MTVGQRRGMGHGTDGTRRYVTARRRGRAPGDRRRRAADVLRSSVVLAAPSLTLGRPPLAAGARAVAQVSAHGRPGAVHGRARRRGDDMVVRFDAPQRPVAPGQTVALYDAAEPDAVVGAGIAA